MPGLGIGGVSAPGLAEVEVERLDDEGNGAAAEPVGDGVPGDGEAVPAEVAPVPDDAPPVPDEDEPDWANAAAETRSAPAMTRVAAVLRMESLLGEDVQE